MSALTYIQFLEYSGYTDATVPNEAYVKYLLSSVSEILEDTLNIKFSLVADKTKEYKGKNLDYIVIGGWQKEGLTIKTRYFETVSENALVLNRDYRLSHFKDNDDEPVVAIQLLSNFSYFWNSNFSGYSLYNSNCFLPVGSNLVVTGTYGWSNGFPALLAQTVFMLVKTMAEINNQMTKNKGAGVTTSLKSVTLTKTSKISDDLIDKLIAIGFDPAGAKQIQSAAKRYTANTKQKVRIP